MYRINMTVEEKIAPQTRKLLQFKIAIFCLYFSIFLNRTFLGSVKVEKRCPKWFFKEIFKEYNWIEKKMMILLLLLLLLMMMMKRKKKKHFNIILKAIRALFVYWTLSSE